MRRVPLPVGDLFRMQPGESFVVFWAKDDDLQYIRCNYAKQTILEIDKLGDILTEDGYEWMRSEIVDPKENLLDTSRGYAYFYKA